MSHFLLKTSKLLSFAFIALFFSFSPVRAENGIDSPNALRILGLLDSGTSFNLPVRPKERPQSRRLEPVKLYRKVKPYINQVPYAWGGTSIETGMDCSAFSRFIIQKYGGNIPRTVKQQARTGRYIRPGDLRAGDLVFFDATYKRGGVDHVGVYIGKGYFIHSHKPHGVRLENLQTYKYRLVFARRVL